MSATAEPSNPAPEFARAFRLTDPDEGLTYDGAVFPSGRGVILDHREQGFARIAVSMGALLEGFPNAHVEWADGQDAALKGSTPEDRTPPPPSQ
jgi:hypothetical protein